MRIRWLYIVAPALVVLAGCGTDKQASMGSAATTLANGGVSGATTVAASTSASPSDAPADAIVPSSPQLVVKAELRVEADDVGETADRAVDANTQLRGTTYSSSIELGDAPKASLVLKVLPASLTAFVDAVKTLGRLTARSQDTEDVTNQIIDVDARVTTARASLGRMRAFLDQATTVAEAAAAETEVTRRETELEKLLAQQNSLTARVAMVTVTLTITRPIAPVTPPSNPPGVIDALHNGGHVTWMLVHGVLVGLAWSAPLIGVALVPGTPLFALWRRRRRAAVPTG
jgi:hypothetical protein